MAATNERIYQLRGKRWYEAQLPVLQGVAIGRFEGAVPSFRQRGIRLMQLHAGLCDERIARLQQWMGQDQRRTLESALELIDVLDLK
jgi:hypothetical protein